MVFESASEQETIGYAEKFAQDLKSGDVVLLYGNLGVGKSVFARAVIRATCAQQDMEVPSPTYTLVQTYDADKGTVWHFDLYRLADESEIYELGWEEALSDGIILVEWPERLGGLLPSKRIELHISAQGQPDQRTIEVKHYD